MVSGCGYDDGGGVVVVDGVDDDGDGCRSFGDCCDCDVGGRIGGVCVSFVW